ncbi:MAG: tyrosine-type recombinase/integrase, partial [Myxococcota bacterium]
MALKFTLLTRANMRTLAEGASLHEHGIVFDRLSNGDGRFRINAMIDGNRIHRVVGLESDGMTREQAEVYLEKIRTEAREARLHLPKGRKLAMTLEEAAQRYLQKLEEEGGKDLKKKSTRLAQHLVPMLGKRPLDALTSSDIERYKKQRLDTGARPATVNRELAVLSHLINKAVEWKWLTHRPAQIRRLREENARIEYLTSEQSGTLLKTAKENGSPYQLLFMLIGLETSMRKSEILSIRLEHMDLKRRVIFIPKAKAGAREQPITERLADYLTPYVTLAEPGQEWLFPSTRSPSGHMTEISGGFRKLVKKAGLDAKKVVRHTLRHTAIT